MYTNKLHPGESFPDITVNLGTSEQITLGQAFNEDADWLMIVVYRGVHCPLCTKYLNELEEYKYLLLDLGIDVIAVSADRKAQLDKHQKELDIGFPIAYGLSLADMDQLGLYQSVPRNEHETDHVFAEPGLFIIDRNKQLKVVDISNNPFCRPDIRKMYEGLKFVRNPDNNYPVRGTHHEPMS